MKHVSLLVVSVLLTAAGAIAGCVGDSPTAADGGAPSSTATGTGTTPVPVPDASVKDTSAPDTSVPDTSTPDAPVAFTPKLVPGLALWLDPTAGVTETAGKVSAWADTFSAITVVQATPANQPTKGTVGSKPVLVFSDSTWLAAASVGTKLDFGTGDLTVVVVCTTEPTATTALTGVLYKFPDVSASPFDGLQVYANLGGGGKPGAGLAGEGLMLTASAGSVSDGKLHLLALRRAGTKLTLRLDGAEVATMTAAARSVDTASPLQIGGRAALVHNAPNKLGDVLIYKGTVSDTDFTSLEGFVKTKNGL